MFTVRNRQISFSRVQKPIDLMKKRLDEKVVDTAENQPLKVRLRFWAIFDGRSGKLPFPAALFTILSENNRREKLLR